MVCQHGEDAEVTSENRNRLFDGKAEMAEYYFAVYLLKGNNYWHFS